MTLRPNPYDATAPYQTFLEVISIQGQVLGVLSSIPLQEARLSPDRDRIAFVRQGFGGLSVHNFATGATAFMLGSSFFRSLSWMPDGASIFAQSDEDLAIIDTSTETVVSSIPCHELLGQDEPDCFDPALSPDGRWIAVYYTRGISTGHPSDGAYLVAAECLRSVPCSRPARRLPVFLSGPRAWAPSGSTLASWVTYLFDVDAWTSRSIGPPETSAESVLWFPDGSGLVWTDSYRLRTIVIGTGQVADLLHSPLPLTLQFSVVVPLDP